METYQYNYGWKDYFWVKKGTGLELAEILKLKSIQIPIDTHFKVLHSESSQYLILEFMHKGKLAELPVRRTSPDFMIFLNEYTSHVEDIDFSQRFKKNFSTYLPNALTFWVTLSILFYVYYFWEANFPSAGVVINNGCDLECAVKLSKVFRFWLFASGLTMLPLMIMPLFYWWRKTKIDCWKLVNSLELEGTVFLVIYFFVLFGTLGPKYFNQYEKVSDLFQKWNFEEQIEVQRAPRSPASPPSVTPSPLNFEDFDFEGKR